MASYMLDRIARHPWTPASSRSATIWRGRSFHRPAQHGEYVRGGAHVNGCENYFSILKRGINGVYQHVSPTHLKR